MKLHWRYLLRKKKKEQCKVASINRQHFFKSTAKAYTDQARGSFMFVARCAKLLFSAKDKAFKSK